jgi:hypothetical protein
VFGKADGSAIDLGAIADANNPIGGFVINGAAANDKNGISVSSAGDVNGDGITKPPEELPVAIVLRLMALLSALPNTT